MKDIGTELRKLRDKKRLSTREIADRMQIPQSTYMKWEHSKSCPTLRDLDKLAAALEIGPIELVVTLIECRLPEPMEINVHSEELKPILEALDQIKSLLTTNGKPSSIGGHSFLSANNSP